MYYNKKLPKVHNHPLGKNSPNLVTLLETDLCNIQGSSKKYFDLY
jgi:hypothetical protein